MNASVNLKQILQHEHFRTVLFNDLKKIHKNRFIVTFACIKFSNQNLTLQQNHNKGAERR